MTRFAAVFALSLGLAPWAGLAAAEPTVTSTHGVVRVLDKITGTAHDVELLSGQSEVIGHLTVTMGECRYPTANPTGDAYVQLVILDSREPEPVFQGWMVASAPALNALDHPRYDVWALRCDVPSSAEPVLNLQPAPEPAPAE